MIENDSQSSIIDLIYICPTLVYFAYFLVSVFTNHAER